MKDRTLIGLSLLAVAGVAAGLAYSDGASNTSGGTACEDPYASLPMSLTLTGTVRDFRERTISNGGHTDFEWQPSGGYGLYANSVQDNLDADGKPVFRSVGYKVNSQAADASGRKRLTREYISTRSGDQAASIATTTGGSLHTSEAFAQWFRDVPGMNASAPLDVTLTRASGSNLYVFDDKNVPVYQQAGGFFPINGQLYGNSAGDSKNFHFTYELATNFVYERGAGHVFTFTGDDDVWVYIDGKLVVDLGGVHGATSQTIELDRLSWLEDGHVYSLKFFFAERHRTQSNCRIETTLRLRNVEAPQISALYD